MARWARGLTKLSALLAHWSNGNEAARDELIPLVYNELRKLAGHYMAHERGGHTCSERERGITEVHLAPAVGVLYERPFFLESTEYGRSQTAPTVWRSAQLVQIAQRTGRNAEEVVREAINSFLPANAGV